MKTTFEKEDKLNEIRAIVFSLQIQTYINENNYLNFINEGKKEYADRCLEIKEELFKETMWRIQDYIDIDVEDSGDEELNYDDYSWIEKKEEDE